MSQLPVLASDTNNPAFVGATNPDSVLIVRFHNERPLKNEFESVKQQRPVWFDVVWIEIKIAGNEKLIIERPMTEGDKARFPLHWAHYQNTHSNDPAKQGTPLNQWPLLQPSQVVMLRAMHFETVEQVAFSSDENISKIGMLAGMAPLSFRNAAKGYLSVAKDASILQRQADENKALQDKIDKQATDFAEQMAEMRAMVVAVQQQRPQRAAKPAKKTRAPMSEERKEALRVQLADARAKKAAGVSPQPGA